MENKVIITYYDVNKKLSEEILWIEKKNESGYLIKNVPFFAPNLAYDDVISVEEDDGNLYFDEILETSEHSTIQIVMFNTEKISDVTENIENFKCSWEGMDDQKIIAVDVPPSVDYSLLKKFLDAMLAENILDYKEACLSDIHSKNLKK